MKTPNPSNLTAARKYAATLRRLTTTLVMFFCLTLAASAQNLVGLYQFDDTGNLGKDSSGRNNHLAATGTGYAATTGKYGGGLSLTGNTYFTTASGTAPAGFPLENSGYTISAWVKTAAVGAYGIIGWGGYGTTQAVNGLRTGTNGSGDGFMNSWWANDLIYNGAVSNNTFHNVTATFDGTTRKLYLDGTQVMSDTPGSVHAATAANFALGRTSPGLNEFFQGILDNVAVWDGALSATQVATAANNTFPLFSLSASTSQTIYGVAGGASTTIPVTVTDSPITIGQTYTVSSNQSWLTASPTSNATGGSSTFNLTANPGSLAPGTYTGTVTVGAPTFLTRAIAVTFEVVNPSAPFKTGVTVPLGVSGMSVVTGDFNGDGLMDIATANYAANTITVLLGNGSGGFSPAISSPFATGGSLALSLAAGDFNGDGKTDLAVANGSSTNVSVLLGNGAGGFTAASGSPFTTSRSAFAPGEVPNSVVAGDFNGDGNTDLATSNQASGNVTVLLGNGAGGFAHASGSPFAVGATPQRIVAGDFNGDGKLDLATANSSSNNVTVLLGNGAGGFAQPTGSPITVGTTPLSIVAGDFNGDGNTDLATANNTTNNITVLLGNGSGGFTAPSGSPFAAGSAPFSVAAGDFNGDGKTDLAATNYNSGTVTLMLGNGSGGFTAASGSPFAAGTNPRSLAIGDFNGDGRTDLSVANFGSNNVTVLLGAGPTSITISSSANPAAPGQSITLTATITPSTATGTVTFKDGTATLGTGTLSGGTATFATAGLSLGSHSITAVYAGDTAYAGSTSPALTQAVKTATTTILHGATSVSLGQSITFDAFVSGTGTGTVTFLDGQTVLGTRNVGTSFTTSALTAGVHSITAVYNGDATYAASTSAALSVTVLSPTSISLASSSNPAIAGQTVTYTATVTPSDATGTVTLSFSGFSQTQSLTNGVATFTTNSLLQGTVSMSANYGGDSTHTFSVNGLTQQVLGATTVFLSTSPNPSNAGQSVNFTAQLSLGQGFAPFSGGTVVIKDGATTLTTLSAAISPAMTFSTSALSAGVHSLTAVYSGDSNWAGSTSSTVSQTVAGPSSTALASSLNPSGAGQGVTFTASITPASATGSVTFKDGATTLGTGNLIGGAATFTTAGLSVGTHSITAVYGGDSANFSSTSGAVSQVVIPVFLLNTSTAQTIYGVAGGASTTIPVTVTDSPTTVGQTYTVSSNQTWLTASPASNATGGSSTFNLTANPGSLAAGTYAGTITIGATFFRTRTIAVTLVVVKPSVPFKTGATVQVGSSPESVVAGDFNGDGNPDLATANAGSDSITVLLGDGSGGFTPASGSPIAVGTDPQSVVAGDFNGDGKTDLAVANYLSNNVTVLLGNGAGGFTAASGSPVAVGSSPQSVVTGDFNGDGKTDLATANWFSNNITVLLGNGSGGFTEASGSPVAVGNGPVSVVAGDFSGDGMTDLAIANSSSNSVTVLLGNGAGGFTAASGSPITVGSSPQSVVTGDFNGDGKTDLATANYESGNTTVLLGNGLGGFTAATGSPFTSGTGPSSVVAGDFNGDGKTDLATAASSGDVTLLLGNGSGLFTPASGSPFLIGSLPHSLVVGDFNGDGRTDLAIADDDLNLIEVLLGGVPTSTALSSSANPSAPGQSVTFAATVTPSSATGTVTFMDGASTLGTGTLSGGTATFSTSSLVLGTHSVTAVYSGDALHAGSTSSAVSQSVKTVTTTSVVSSLNPAAPGQSVTFTATVTPAAATGTVTFKDGAATLGTGTLSGGAATLATAALTVGTHSITAVYGGDSTNAASTSGALSQVVQAIPTSLALTSSTSAAAPGQTVTFTAAITPSSATGSITFLDGATTLGTGTLAGGTATFATSALAAGTHSITAAYAGTAGYTAATSAATSVLIGSVTVKPGLLKFYGVVSGASSTIPVNVTAPAGTTPSIATSQTWLTAQDNGNGSVSLTANPATLTGGTYSATATFTGAGLPPATTNVNFNVANRSGAYSSVTLGGDNPMSGAATGDFNLDGKPDLATTSQTGRIRVLLSNGNGGFSNASGSPFTSSDNALSIGVGDFNNDGKPDLAVATFSDIRIYLGLGTGQFTLSGAARIAISSPSRPVVSDYNLDGKLDIITRSSNSIFVLLGDGSGAFSQAPGSPFTSPGASTNEYAAGDVNGDGIPDLVLAHDSPANTVSVMLGDGFGRFTHAAGSPMAGGTRPWAVAIGDINNDGKPDLVVSNYTANAVKVWTGDGSGAFTSAGTFSTQSNPISIVIADLNGDGKADLGVANFASNSVSVLAGNGAGSFAAAVNYGTGNNTNPWQLVNADFNNDGRMDLATPNLNTGNVTVLLGDRLTPSITWSNSSVTYPAAVSAANLNASASSGGNSVPGSFAYTYVPSGTAVALTAGTQLNAGTWTVTATFTPADSATYKPATATAVITVNKGTPTITWPTPAAIAFGSALSASQLNATASSGGNPLTGTYVYTPAAGIVLSAGVNRPLSVQFTPADSANYNTASGSTTITVTPSGAVSGSKPIITVTRGVPDRIGGNILVTVNFANNGGSDATNVVVNSVKIGTTSASTALPLAVGTIPPSSSVSVTFTIPGSAGAAGASATMTVNGTFTGGTFNPSLRMTLP